MRISGLWIFGLVECVRDNQGQSKSRRPDFLTWKEEIRLLSFHLSEVNDQLAVYNSLDVNREFHRRTVNHSENFISVMCTHTRNVEKMWSFLKSHNRIYYFHAFMNSCGEAGILWECTKRLREL
ncbi:hypothetical protein RF11_02373 [Thelohanellus kitauei]|uniref:Uncharacterized protein n=1 Tax=Thelohanellus kitauei TaxID=669202 RepID=A0A0C2MFA3_THEKT|nr:hypothetical protein RF11_02373 [Thelohanellus kitauei]